MAATGGREDLSAAISDEANAWLLRFTNGVVDDDDDVDVDDDEEEEEVEDEGEEGEGGAAGETKDSCAEEESSHRRRRGAPGEELSEDDYVKVGGGLEGRKRKATVTPHKVQSSKVGIKNKKVQAQYLSALAKDAERLSQENENLRWQLTSKAKDLEHAKQMFKLELDLKNKDIEYLKKQNNESKDENENYKKTAKSSRALRLCRYCKESTNHDYRNCPKRKSDEDGEEEDEDSN